LKTPRTLEQYARFESLVSATRILQTKRDAAQISGDRLFMEYQIRAKEGEMRLDLFLQGRALDAELKIIPEVEQGEFFL